MGIEQELEREPLKRYITRRQVIKAGGTRCSDLGFREISDRDVLPQASLSQLYWSNNVALAPLNCRDYRDHEAWIPGSLGRN